MCGVGGGYGWWKKTIWAIHCIRQVWTKEEGGGVKAVTGTVEYILVTWLWWNLCPQGQNYRDDDDDDDDEEESGYLITVVTLKSWWYLDIKVLNIVRRYHN